MTKRTEFKNLVLVTENDLRDVEEYRVQSIKERIGSSLKGYNKDTSAEFASFGSVKETTDCKVSGVEDTEYTSNTFTLTSGTAFTRWKEETDLTLNTQYDGQERCRLPASITTTIKHNTVTDPDNYLFLVYVELHTNKKYDESGFAVYYIDREETYAVAQLTQAELTTLGTFSGNPNGSVTVTGVEANHVEALLDTSGERGATFSSWSSTGVGNFTIGSLLVTHYNSIFLGKVLTTNNSPIKYKFYNSGGGWTRPEFSAVDQYHRNQFGSGTYSETNPHAVALTDSDLYAPSIEGHRTDHHSNGLIPKFTTSLKCVIDGTATPDAVVITPLAGGEYLFLNGKRITSVSPLTLSSFSSTGTYFFYVQSGSTVVSSVAPYDVCTGTVGMGTSIPVGAYALCSVYYDSGTQIAKAYLGDPRYNAGAVNNPTTDLRLFGNVGYDKIHDTHYFHRENLIPNGDCEIVENDKIKGWTTGNKSAILALSGSGALRVATGGTDNSLLFPFDSNSDYTLRFKSHTEGASCTYIVKLLYFRGKNGAYPGGDYMGYSTLYSGSMTSSWGLTEATYVESAPAITWYSPFTIADISYIGYASIEVSVSSGNLNLDDIILRPQIRAYDINTNVVGFGLGIHSDRSIKVVADESTITVDTSNDYIKVKNQGIGVNQVSGALGALTIDTYIRTSGGAIRYDYGPATTDLVVHARETRVGAGGAAIVLIGYCDTSATPTIIRQRCNVDTSGGLGDNEACITFVVKKGEYWGVSAMDATGFTQQTTLTYISIGS